MKKNLGIIIRSTALVIAIALFATGSYKKIAELGVVNYVPAAVDSIFQKQEPVTPSVTFTFGGDIMLDRGVERSVIKNFAGDFSQLFKNAESFFQNDDITVLNLEGPASDKGHNVGSIYSFEMNPSVLPIIKSAGIDVVSFANNHVGDYTKAAFTDTMNRMTAAGLEFSGAGKNYADATTPKIIEKNGIKIGFLGFTDVGPNWLAAKSTIPDSAGILIASDPNFSSIISSAKTQADVLVVSFHWGNEYKPHTDRQAQLAHAAIDAGADIIAGHHPHVAQDIEMYKDKLIIYSMGNFIFDQYFSKETMQGLVVQTTVKKDLVSGAISIVDTKEYINQLNKNYAIESITEKYPKPKTNDTPAEIVVGWVGDIPPSRTMPQFDETVLATLKAPDIMAGNLEGVLSTTASSKCGSGSPNCFSFVGNTDFAATLATVGFDIMNLANNHALDKGAAGITTTKAKLTAANLLFTPQNDTQDKSEPVVINIKGNDVAFLSFGHNAWTTKITEIEKIKQLVTQAAAKYSVVIVMFHGGAEGSTKTHVTKKTEYYIGENRGNVYAFAHAAIDSGADLVLGSGPHVIRGIEKYKDRLVVYSAGNFLTTEGMNSNGILGKAGIFTMTVDQNGVFKNLSILSTTGQIKNSISIDPTNETLNKVIELTKQDFGQIISANTDGSIVFN